VTRTRNAKALGVFAVLAVALGIVLGITVLGSGVAATSKPASVEERVASAGVYEMTVVIKTDSRSANLRVTIGSIERHVLLSDHRAVVRQKVTVTGRDVPIRASASNASPTITVSSRRLASLPTGSTGALVDRSSAPHCAWYSGSGVPAGSGIPPWGFHASQSFAAGGSGSAYGWGDVNLDTNWISGKVCQDVSGGGRPARMISVSIGPKIGYHSHIAMMWGYPGNLIKTSLSVTASTDPRCTVGTSGRVIMYASYNGVRSDSMQFLFNAGCRGQDRLYHGPQVDAQVPPL
jgi:hypothetical protein